MYFSHHGYNCLYLLSDVIYVQGIANSAGEDDPVAAHKKLMGEVSSAATHLIEFAKAFTAAAWIKHFGLEMEAKDVINIQNAPDIDSVGLPFFVEA